MVRLAPDYPLRHEDSLLIRKKLKSFLNSLELIKDILQAAVALHLVTRIVLI
jgi:hypothetical protein